MGHKVNPECLRLQLSHDWRSRWFAPTKKQFVKQLQEDRKIRELLQRELSSAAVSRVVIDRSAEKISIAIHTARPGIVIGRRGEHIERLKNEVQKIVGMDQQLKMDPVEVPNPNVEAQLIAESLAFQLTKRIAFRRAMKRAMQLAMDSKECKGIKVICDGRLAGAEMTRREVYRAGTVPLGTLRARIEFGSATAHTTAGCIGTKVWVCRGELVSIERGKLKTRDRAPSEPAPAAAPE